MASISSLSIATTLQSSITKMQSQLNNASLEASTGRYADVGLTLGAETGQSVSLRDQQTQLQSITGANSNVATRLNTTSTALTSMLSTAQSFLNTMTETTVSATDTSTAAVTAQQDLASMIGELNTSVNGEYIFGGIATQSAPITDYYSTGSANQAAVDSSFQSTFGMSQTDPNTSTIDPTSMQNYLDNVFAPQFTGTNWSSNWSQASSTTITNQISTTQTMSTSVSANDTAFQNLAQAYTMVAEFGGSHLGETAMQTVITTARNLVSEAVQQLTNVQAGVGEAKNALTNSNQQMSAQLDVLSTGIGNLENVDAYKATTQVTDLQTQIETAYELTNKLQNLSLVNYLT
jgi:flagellar hook-associated protein 3 FlgL